MIRKVYGINVAVKDFKSALERFVHVLNVKPKFFKETDFAFPNLIGAQLFFDDVAINVIGSKSEKTAIAKFVNSRGEGVFLVSLLVDDIENDVIEMKTKGVNFVTEIKEVPLGKVIFSHPKSMHGVQFEFLQLKR